MKTSTVFLLSLVVTYVASTPVSKLSEAAKLKQLLKQYIQQIDDEELQAKSAEITAYSDIRTVYAPSTTEGSVAEAASLGTGYWTKWLNVDANPHIGPGEYENCERAQYVQNKDRMCYLGCEKPIAASYAIANSATTATWSDIENCIGPITSPERVSSCGFNCSNDDAGKFPKTQCDKSRCLQLGLGEDCDRCPDVRVQYFCHGTMPDENACCPYSSACSGQARVSLRASLDDIASVNTRRDIVAGILHEVKGALEDIEARELEGDK